MSYLKKVGHLQIPLEEVLLATNTFSKENIIAEGGFGVVYQGLSEKHGIIAVKRLDRKLGQGDREFLMEISLLSIYKHENIVSLIGFCNKDDEKILVYKHEKNGSLDKHLHSKDLTWIQRLQICLDAARGLKYLHNDVGPQHRILHSDIKSSNILLDDSWKAKISDFGLSRIGLANTQVTFLVSNVCGTLGYVDPEYVETGILTQKSDVYSFGVVLFEVLCGRVACVVEYDDKRRLLSRLGQYHYENKTLDEIIDCYLREQMEPASLSKFSTVAYQCLKKQGDERPTMSFVVEQLQKALYYQQPLDEAEGSGKHTRIESLRSFDDLSYGQNESRFKQRPMPLPLPNNHDWEIDPAELDFSDAKFIVKVSAGEIIRASWCGTSVAVKRILPSLLDNRLAVQDFRCEVDLIVKLRHPNIVQFLGAVTEKKPLMLITEYLQGGDLHRWLKVKGAPSPATAVKFALDIARGMAYLHNESNVIVHRNLKPSNILLTNSNADHLKVGDFGPGRSIRVQYSHDIYKMTGETSSYRYMAPEVFKHGKYDKKADVYSFAVILYEMLEGEPPFSSLEAYEAAQRAAEGLRPMFRAKGYIYELRELTEHCWEADMNKRPSFLEILRRLESLNQQFH